VTNVDENNNNISFWSSILTLLNSDYMITLDMEEKDMINKFKNDIIENINKKNLSKFISKYSKNEFREFMKIEVNINILQLIVDTLDINIFIFDFETINIYSIFKNDIMNPWKPTILLAKYKNNYEPIMNLKNRSEIQRLFDHNDLVIKKLLSLDKIKYFDEETSDKNYLFYSCIDDVLLLEKDKIKINIDIDITETSSVKTDSENSNNNLFITNDYNNLTKSKISKMKLSELKELSENLKI
jgi:hypothetical protein